MWEKKTVEDLLQKRKQSENGGGEDRIAKQHAQGKLTARERLSLLFDADTFVEMGGFVESRIDSYGVAERRTLGDGVVTGYGKVNGRLAFASSEDFTVIGGTLGEYHSIKICQVMDKALEMKAPYIAINDSGGARIEEGISSLNGYSGIFLRNTRASGVIPQIAVILGPCAGGACYSPAICDFVFVVKNISQMFITGPQVVKAVTGEDVSSQDLGGASVHTAKSGVAHFEYDDEKSCFDGVKRLLSYLPDNTDQTPATISTGKVKNVDLESVVSDNQKKVYDVHNVIDGLIDMDTFFEVQHDFAKNVVVGFARMHGDAIGVVANQPNYLGGALDIDASDKAARFVRFCDCFNIPILSLVDVPGFLPGKQQEHNGIIRHGAKLLYAYSEASVPKVTLIMRKAYGGAYIAMNSKGMGGDVTFAWPIAQIAVMGAEGAVDIIYRHQIKESVNPVEARKTFIKQYEEQCMNPYNASYRGLVDEVILPSESREKILKAFDMLKTKKTPIIVKKHGNIPL